jgi:hypothetical protein
MKQSGKHAPLKDGDTVTIVPSIAGGKTEGLATSFTNGHGCEAIREIRGIRG